MKKLLCGVLGVGMLIGIAHASDEVIVLGNESMPFNGIVDGKNAGMTFEILEEATKHGAPKFIYQLGLPWKRAQIILHDAGDSPTAIVPFTRTPEREEKHVWIAELLSYQTRLSVYKQSSPISLEEATSKDIGIILGSAHIPLLRQLGLTKLQEVSTAFQNANKLAAKRIDMVAESQYVDTYNWKLAGLKTEDLKFIPIGEVKHIYIAGNLDFPPELAKRIYNAVERMRENGRLQDILKRWEE